MTTKLSRCQLLIGCEGDKWDCGSGTHCHARTRSQPTVLADEAGLHASETTHCTLCDTRTTSQPAGAARTLQMLL